MRSLSEPWFVPMRIARPQFLAELHQRREFLLDALQLGRILLVGVFLDREFLGVGVVAGIDADLLDPLGRFHRGVGLEMDVRHDRHVAAARAQSAHDVLQVGRVLDRRRGDAHDLATDRRQFERLRDGRFRVHRVAGEHRLHREGRRDHSRRPAGTRVCKGCLEPLTRRIELSLLAGEDPGHVQRIRAEL